MYLSFELVVSATDTSRPSRVYESIMYPSFEFVVSVNVTDSPRASSIYPGASIPKCTLCMGDL
eukprot:8121486-Pyramimonas_sp.AAC.1